MNELEGMINGLLSNPDEMKKIMEIAGSVMGGSSGSQGDTQEAPAAGGPELTQGLGNLAGSLGGLGNLAGGLGGLGGLLGGLSNITPNLGQKAKKLISGSATGRRDEKEALFAALRPFLSERRQGKLDRATQAAKAMSVGLSLFGKKGGG